MHISMQPKQASRRAEAPLLNLEDPAEANSEGSQSPVVSNSGIAASSTEEDVESARGITWVPAILQLFNMIFMLGSGMMLKYCPLFFKTEYHLSPVQLCIVMGMYWLASALGTQSASPLLKFGFGRTQLSLTMHVIGTLGLFCFAWMEPLSLSLTLFMIRAVVTNACLPINTSLMMDHVSARNRGKWAALNSLNRATWSGSSFIGGLIADAHGYRASFNVTAVIFVFAGMAYTPLTCIIPRA